MLKRVWNCSIVEKSYTKASENEENVPKCNLGVNELLNYYWSYFELQSRQRNQTCVLYFTLLPALITAYVAVVEQGMEWAGYIVLVAIILIAFSFGLMFNRTTKLRNNARDCIQEWEKENIYPKDFRLFDCTAETDQSISTYSTLFKIQFFLVGITSFVLLMLTLSGIITFDCNH